MSKIALATGVGTAVEYYDFTAYAIATGIVFNHVFFPEVDSAVGILLSFVIFFTGFLARPIGGVIAGHYGDRIGRKNMLIITMLTMGIATVLVGILPTYEQIGTLAPVLLLILRVLQGLAAGGEWGGSAVVAFEHAPANSRGLYASWSMVGISAGALTSTVAFALLAGMDEDQFQSWGWRIPFVASAFLIILGFWARRAITESTAFESAKKMHAIANLPVVELLRTNWRSVLLGTGISVGYNAFVYLLYTFALSYGTDELGLSRQLLLTAVVVGLVLQIPAIVTAAWLSDRIGRVPLMVAGGLFIAVDAFVFFLLLDTRQPVLVFLTMALAYVGSAMMYGPLAAFFSEAFDVRVRYSGISLCYQLGASLGGGLTPVVLTLLLLSTGTIMVGATYISILGLLAVGCVLGLARRAARREPEGAVQTDGMNSSSLSTSDSP